MQNRSHKWMIKKKRFHIPENYKNVIPWRVTHCLIIRGCAPVLAQFWVDFGTKSLGMRCILSTEILGLGPGGT